MDIFPFSLPNCNAGEVWFEEPRDIDKVVVTLAGPVPRRFGLAYLRKTWPKLRYEQAKDTQNPFRFGWSAMDDWFNCRWQPAAVRVTPRGRTERVLTFEGLRKELGDEADGYDVRFRRTLGIRVEVPNPERIRKIEVYTLSQPTQTGIRVQLDAGTRTRGKEVTLSGYNAVVHRIEPGPGGTVAGNTCVLGRKHREFTAIIDHMRPSHRYCGDSGLVTFTVGDEQFTIRLDDLETEGPIWYAEQGVFVARADDPTDFAAYRKRITGCKTIAERVVEREEQSYGRAFHGQPRPHVSNYNLGCKHARQRFWLEGNGDVLLNERNVRWVPGKDTPLYRNKGSARFFFGLEQWAIVARYNDAAPTLIYNICAKRDTLFLQQRTVAVPLLQSILEGELAGDDPVVLLVQFRVRNGGSTNALVELPIGYSQESQRSSNGFHYLSHQDGNLVPKSPRDVLEARRGMLVSRFEGKPVIRAQYDTDLALSRRDNDVVFTRRLAPGEEAFLLLKIPFVAPANSHWVRALRDLDFDRCQAEAIKFWRDENRRGAQLRTPIDHLNACHAAHLSHVEISDFAMPEDRRLINTSVGTSTYGNFPNESCMILDELEQRGLHEDCERRLAVWIRYQGTAPQPGNFTDYDGMYYGAGGFECGHYNQHHGWVVWRLAEHYLVTGNDEWFAEIAPSLLAGVDWIFRQRQNTMKALPHSRGWEYGFLPAGSLEDVTDFHYWLSTNALTWRGADAAARALEQAGHPEAARVRREADAYRADLIRGFETSRRYAPLVRLANGRWVPQYPSRLYCRGRDLGWIREVLEGSIYLLLSGLYDANTPQASWILDDFQDNRYIRPPYGYPIIDTDDNFYNVGGFSCQPNLLAGLLPYLDRDEPEIYIWMFFNAWVACYREEINGMVEHPAPVLGFSNSAVFKTSDEANAVMWLRYMFVYPTLDTLYLGRAVPRDWLRSGQRIGVQGMVTRFGKVSIEYDAARDGREVKMEITLTFHRMPSRMVARIRHPDKKPIRALSVNGKRYTQFDAEKGDIDLTGKSGKLRITARY